MRTFKLIDCFLQAVLIGLALILGPRQYRTGGDEEFLTWYFLVGGLQVFSVIVHFLFYRPEHKSLLRRIYLITLLIVIVVLVVSIGGFVIEAMFGLLFFSPLMAIWYLVTCIIETKRLREATAAPPVQENTVGDQL